MNAEELASHLSKSAQDHQRFIVAIAGPPGAGKSTLAEDLLARLKDRSIRSKVIPMDGFHLDNSVLSQKGFLDRKGAPETFDVGGFASLLKRLKTAEREIVIPLFDRERDIAIAGAGTVSADDKILIVEGNYLLLNDAPWNVLQAFWNETIAIHPEMDVLERRLIDRWLKQGLDEVRARKRALSNDIPNAQTVLENSAPANIQFTL